MRSLSCMLFLFATSYVTTSIAIGIAYETPKESKESKELVSPQVLKPAKKKKPAKQPLAASKPKPPDRTEANVLENYNAIRDTTASAIGTVGYRLKDQSPACFACAGDAAPPKSCGDAYADLYSKPTLDFRIALGYTDVAGDYVNAEDLPRREILMKRLLRSCGGGVGTCGFKRDPDDMDLFTKDVAGPDGQMHVVRLRLTASSVGVDDKANRTTHLAEQKSSTSRAEKNFFDGLASADVVIYAGHARKGGGPDFAPSYLHPDGLHTDESKYADRVSEKRMLKALSDNPHPPKLIGLFACDAGHWFSQDVREATKNQSGVASSNGPHLTEPEVVFAQAYAMLDSVLALRCIDQFQNSLNALKDAIGQNGDGATLRGFFDDEHPPFTPSLDDPLVDSRFESPAMLVEDPPVRPNGSINPSQPTYDSNHQRADGVR